MAVASANFNFNGIQDPSCRATVKSAVDRGWLIEKAQGSGKPKLVNNGHWLTISLTPSDHRANKNFAAAIRRCEAGNCNHEHAKPIEVLVKEKRVSNSTMTMDEAAAHFGVSKASIHAWVKSGKLERYGEKGNRGTPGRVTLESVERLDEERANKRRKEASGEKPSMLVPPSHGEPVEVLFHRLEGVAIGLQNEPLSVLIAQLKRKVLD